MGREEGISIGVNQEKVNAAKGLLREGLEGLGIDMISRVTGLSVSEINKLKTASGVSRLAISVEVVIDVDGDRLGGSRRTTACRGQRHRKFTQPRRQRKRHANRKSRRQQRESDPKKRINRTSSIDTGGFIEFAWNALQT